MTEEEDRPPGEEEEEVKAEPLVAAVEAKIEDVVKPVGPDEQKSNEASTKDVLDAERSEVVEAEPAAAQAKNESEKPEQKSSTLVASGTQPIMTSAVPVTSVAPADPYAGYTGYDPAAAGYDYSAYWAQYGYQASAYSYPGEQTFPHFVQLSESRQLQLPVMSLQAEFRLRQETACCV